MSDKETSSTEDSFNSIRSRLKQDHIQVDFKKKLIGGISAEDVTNYIGDIQSKSEQEQEALKKQIEGITYSKAVLQRELENYRQMAEEEKIKLQESIEETRHELLHYINQCKSKDAVIRELEDRYNLEISRLNNKILQAFKERESLAKRLTQLERELDHAKAYAARVENQNSSYKAQIADLEKAVSSGNIKLDERIKEFAELKQQAEHERSRSTAKDKETEILKQKIVRMEEALKVSQRNADEYRKTSEQAEQQLMAEGARVESSNQTMDILVSTLEKIKIQLRESQRMDEEQGNARSAMEQLEIERLRADKAEKDRAELFKWIFGMKNRNFNDQNRFEAQFKEIQQNHRILQSDIDSLYTNLQNFMTSTDAELETLCAAADNTNKISDDSYNR